MAKKDIIYTLVNGIEYIIDYDDAESICLQINVMGRKAGDADLLTLHDVART